jgi:hypothetical protein
VVGEHFLSRDEIITHTNKGYLGKHYILKPIKWRAEKGSMYYVVSVSSDGFDVEANKEAQDSYDNSYHKTGNYHRTSEEAQAVADKINAMFKENN